MSEKINDAVTVTRNGQAIADVRKVIEKPHMKQTIAAIRQKIRYVTKPDPSAAPAK